MTWPFGDLQMFGYQLLHIDPPWGFENWSEKGEDRNANQHYPTMTWQEIAALPVGHLASNNCACFLWCVDPLLDKGFECLRAWGFRYTTVAFTWAKRTRKGRGWHMSTGYYTRANPETCLLGVTGSMQRQSAAVRQLVVPELLGGRAHGAHLVGLGAGLDHRRNECRELRGGPTAGVQ